MGSNGVSVLFPELEGGGDAPTPHFAYAEVFDKVFPFYLSIGMTYDQFWNDDVELVRFYREAHRLKQQARNQDMWIQGAYIYDALCCAAPLFRDFAKKDTRLTPYRDEPYPFFEKRKTERKNITKEQKSDAKAKVAMEMFMVNFNRKFDKKGGEQNGG